MSALEVKCITQTEKSLHSTQMTERCVKYLNSNFVALIVYVSSSVLLDVSEYS